MIVIISYILTALIAIVIWQIITLIVAIKDEYVAHIVGTLVPYCFILIISEIIKNIYLLWCRNNLNCYCFCCNNKGKITKSRYFYATEKSIKGLNQNNTADHYIEKCKSCKGIKSVPFSCDIYRREDVFYGWQMDLFKVKED